MNKEFWTKGAGSYIIPIFIALTIRWAFLEAYVIPSGSMLPSLLINDHIFVNKFIYGLRVPFTDNWLTKWRDPDRGEVIVFKYPEDESLYFIKRVVGLPGDKVYYEDGNLYINEELVEKNVPQEKLSDFKWLKDDEFADMGLTKEDHSHWEETLGETNYSVLLQNDAPSRSFGPYTVPKESYFVLGDNRNSSKDSRYWAADKTFVPRKNLMGRAMFVWLSCEDKLSDSIPLVSAICSPLSLRWKRFFHSVSE